MELYLAQNTIQLNKTMEGLPSRTDKETTRHRVDGEDIYESSSSYHRHAPEVTRTTEVNNNDDTNCNNDSNDSNNSITATDQENDPPTRSKNITYCLLYTFFAFASRSMWNQSVLSAFVYLLKSNDPKFVGLLTCVMGVAQLLSSFPAAVLADKYRRDTMLKISAVVGLLAATLTYAASMKQNFLFLGVALAFWGFFWGISNTSILALFADSMNDGERSKYFTQRTIVQFVGNSTGPLVALIMFSFIGNDWTIGECQFVLASGQFLAIPGLIMICFLNDDYVVTTDNDDVSGDSDVTNNVSNDVDALSSDTCTAVGNECQLQIQETDKTCHDDVSESSNDLEAPLLPRSIPQVSTNSTVEDFNNNPPIDDENENSLTELSCNGPKSRLVPILITTADILSGLASGMSIRYFPIFFLDNLHLTPMQVQIAFLSSMVGLVIMGQIAQRAGSKFGRLQTTIFFKWFGASLMISMVACYQNHAPTILVSILWVLRTSSMNAPTALTKSILMDSVPANERAKWGALESVNMFGWAGSAALGGYLVDWEGIEFNFYLTASLQLVATKPLFFLFGRVPRESN